MRLLQMKNHVLDIAPEALSIRAFRALWDRDKSKDKKVALAELSYVWFMRSRESDFNYILDDEGRSEEVQKVIVGLPKNWKPDSKIKEAEEEYTKLSTTVISKLFDNARAAVERISIFLGNVDPSEKDRMGKYLFDAKKIADTIKTVPDLAEALDNAEKMMVKKEEGSNVRGSKTKSTFEDGDL